MHELAQHEMAVIQQTRPLQITIGVHRLAQRPVGTDDRRLNQVAGARIWREECVAPIDVQSLTVGFKNFQGGRDRG